MLIFTDNHPYLSYEIEVAMASGWNTSFEFYKIAVALNHQAVERVIRSSGTTDAG